MATETYVPAVMRKIMRKYEAAGKIINYLMTVHHHDEKRIKKVVNIDIHLAMEIDDLENKFGGKK